MGQAGGRLSVQEGWDELSAAAEGDEDSRTPRAPGFSLLGQLEGGFQVPSGTRDSKNLPRSIVWGRWPMCPGQCVSGWPLLLPADSPGRRQCAEQSRGRVPCYNAGTCSHALNHREVLGHAQCLYYLYFSWQPCEGSLVPHFTD